MTIIRNPLTKSLLIVWVCILSLLGCVSQQRRSDPAGFQLLKQNMKAGHELALLFKLNSEVYQSASYPKTLDKLSDELRYAGIKPIIPQCMCLDGKMRNFDYISGLGITDSQDDIFLVSPKEMGSDLSIVVDLDGKSAVLSSEKAAEEVERSRMHAKKKYINGSPNSMSGQ